MSYTQMSLDSYNLNVMTYKVSKRAKFFQYTIPNSTLDTILQLGAYNRQHYLELVATSDVDAENIILLLQKTTNTLIDIENNSHTVALVGAKNESYGGKAGYYIFDCLFVETNQ